MICRITQKRDSKARTDTDADHHRIQVSLTDAGAIDGHVGPALELARIRAGEPGRPGAASVA
jgi:hypothetical protein